MNGMKKTLRFLFPVLLIAFLGTAPSNHAAVATGTLAGTVLDAHGKPVDYATVTLQTSEGDRPNLTRTDGDGHFEFARYQTGEYDVRAQAGGLFSDWTKHIRIHARKTTAITLRLRDSQDPF
jgi:5-hydroxyisourate hydrolase-like protein (transthyretin family)